MTLQRKIVLFFAMTSAVLCICGFLFAYRVFYPDLPHGRARGERLGFATFRPNEWIIVKSAHGDRRVSLREYRFYWAAGARYVDILGKSDQTEDRDLPPRVGGHLLLERETHGLDALLRWFRTQKEEYWIGTGRYEITYYRDNRQVGDELFFGYSLPFELMEYRRQAAAGVPIPDSDYSHLAARAGLRLSELDQLYPFEMLEPVAAPEPAAAAPGHD